MHVQGVIETTAEVVDGVFAASLCMHGQVILLVVKVHGDGSAVDVLWPPSKGHIRLE